MDSFEFVVPKRPVSHQTKSRKNLKAWKDFVLVEAVKAWAPGVAPESVAAIRFSIVYLCGEAPADIDNIIKPIQDALVGLVFKDDDLVSDVDSHRRYLDESIDLTRLPLLLQNAVSTGQECVYVRVSEAQELGSYL